MGEDIEAALSQKILLGIVQFLETFVNLSNGNSYVRKTFERFKTSIKIPLAEIRVWKRFLAQAL